MSSFVVRVGTSCLGFLLVFVKCWRQINRPTLCVVSYSPPDHTVPDEKESGNFKEAI